MVKEKFRNYRAMSVDTTSMNSQGGEKLSGLEAIRARRARLEALTAQMKLPQLTSAYSSQGRRPLPEYDIRSPLYPERKSAKLNRDRRRASAAVKLEPLSISKPNGQFEFDKRNKEDKLLHSASSSRSKPKETDNELLDLWKNQKSPVLPVINRDRTNTPLRTASPLSARRHNTTERVKEERKKEDNIEQESKEDDKTQEDNKEKDKTEENKADEENSDEKKELEENKAQSNEPINDVIEMLRSHDEQVQSAGAQIARIQLSDINHPPIDEYIEAGIIPVMIICLKKQQYPTLQFECLWALTNITSGTSQQAMVVCESEALAEIIALLGSPDDKVADQAVWTVSNIAGDSGDLRDRVVVAGALPQLQKLIHRKPASSENALFFLKNLSWAFSNILRHKPLRLTPEEVKICVEAVSLFVHHSDQEIHTNALWSLAYVADGDNGQIQQVIYAGVMPRVVELLNSIHDEVITAALRAAGNVLTGDDTQTDEVITAGVVRPLIKLLDNHKSSIKKEAAWSLSNIMAGTPQQIEVTISSGAFLKISTILLEKDDLMNVKKECVWCFSNVCASGSIDQVEKLVYYDGIKALASVLESQDKTVVRVALDGIRNIANKVITSKGEIEEAISENLLEVLCNSSDFEVHKIADELLTDIYGE